MQMPDAVPLTAGIIVIAAILFVVGISVSFKGNIHF